MSWSRRLLSAPGAVPAGLAAFSLLVAFLQRPGRAFTDSRIELTLDPGRFIGDVTEVWSSTGDLGHVGGGLFAGYLFPLAPWYVAANALGVSDWVAQRLLVGLVLALSAWGVVRLMDALWDRRRGLAHVIAGLVFVLSPYVAVELATRGTVPLLAYVVVPWTLLVVHRGLEEPRGWRWPAALGLLLAAAGGAINAAHIFWIMAGGALLAVYEILLRERRSADARAFAWRGAVCVVVASLWWIVPLLLQGAVGADFQQFAEQPGTIWETTSFSESVRVLGFWVMYLGAGFGKLEPQTGLGADYAFNALIVVATFLVPLLAFGGLRWTRGWRYAPFFGLLAVVAILGMFAGFPPGSPLRRTLLWLNDNVQALEVLRTTYKAAPLLALSLACLAGTAAPALLERVRGARLRPLATAALLAVPLLAGLPLLQGHAVDRDAAYSEVPADWTAAMEDAERATPGDRRVMLLPGELFGYYRWGYTNTSVGPVLGDRPVLVRESIRYADPRANQLLDSTDGLLEQARLVPGQLPAVLRLMGVGRVIVRTDLRTEQSGSVPPVEADAALADQPELTRPTRTWGERQPHAPATGRSGRVRPLPRLSAYPVRGSQGIVRVHPRSGGTVLEGDADGLVELAAHGALRPSEPLHYAADLNGSELRDRIRSGAGLVFTDTARRRVVNPARFYNERSYTLGPYDPVSPDAAIYEAEEIDLEHRTTALYSGLSYLRSPLPPNVRHFPEHRPYAALDGRLDTAWLGPRDESQRYFELELRRPLRVERIRVHPHSDRKGKTSRIAVSVNGGPQREVELKPGWNTVKLGAAELRRLRIRVERVAPTGDDEGNGGIDEVEVPGLRTRESLRLPGALARAARGLDLSRSPVSVLLQRTTADFPYRAGAGVANSQVESPLDMVDAEFGIERDLELPVARRFMVVGWATAAPAGNDAGLDRLAGIPRGWRFTSSSRFEGVPSRRASSAFDGDRRTSWVGDWLPRRRPWIAFQSPEPVTVRSLVLRPGRPEYRFPSRIAVRAGGVTRTASVRRDGAVRLPAPVRGRRARIDVLESRVRRGLPRRRRLRGVAVSEVAIPGVRFPVPRRGGRFTSRCGELKLVSGRSRARALVTGRLEDLDAGRPLRLRGCGETLALPAGLAHLSAPPGSVFRPDHVRLHSPRPSGHSAARGAVVEPGRGGDGRRDRTRLRVAGPSWLVLGESYSPAWRAWCKDGGVERDLGEPEPIDGFANGWRIGSGCREARFAFVPQTAATVSQWLSLLGALVLLALLLLGFRRARVAGTAASGPSGVLDEPSEGQLKLGWRGALAAGAAVAAVCGFVFALRVGAVLGPVAGLALRTGITVRRLLAAGTLLLALLPVLYLVFPAKDLGGYNFRFAEDNLAAHWVAVAAICCIAAACTLEVADRRARR